jgi:hypothetical protein
MSVKIPRLPRKTPTAPTVRDTGSLVSELNTDPVDSQKQPSEDQQGNTQGDIASQATQNGTDDGVTAHQPEVDENEAETEENQPDETTTASKPTGKKPSAKKPSAAKKAPAASKAKKSKGVAKKARVEQSRSERCGLDFSIAAMTNFMRENTTARLSKQAPVSLTAIVENGYVQNTRQVWMDAVRNGPDEIPTRIIIDQERMGTGLRTCTAWNQMSDFTIAFENNADSVTAVYKQIANTEMGKRMFTGINELSAEDRIRFKAANKFGKTFEEKLANSAAEEKAKKGEGNTNEDNLVESDISEDENNMDVAEDEGELVPEDQVENEKDDDDELQSREKKPKRKRGKKITDQKRPKKSSKKVVEEEEEEAPVKKGKGLANKPSKAKKTPLKGGVDKKRRAK